MGQLALRVNGQKEIIYLAYYKKEETRKEREL